MILNILLSTADTECKWTTRWRDYSTVPSDGGWGWRMEWFLTAKQPGRYARSVVPLPEWRHWGARANILDWNNNDSLIYCHHLLTPPTILLVYVVNFTQGIFSLENTMKIDDSFCRRSFVNVEWYECEASVLPRTWHQRLAGRAAAGIARRAPRQADHLVLEVDTNQVLRSVNRPLAPSVTTIKYGSGNNKPFLTLCTHDKNVKNNLLNIIIIYLNTTTTCLPRAIFSTNVHSIKS